MAIFRDQFIVRGRTVTIRNAEPDDAAAVIAHIRALDEETPFLAREPGEYATTEAEERILLRDRMLSDGYRFALAEIDGELVGLCRTAYGTLARFRHAAEIGLGVRKAHWGQGLGRLLVETSLEWLRARGVEQVRLDVDTQNTRALGLYMRLGFVVEGTFRRERKMADGTYRDSYHMALNMPEESTP